MVGALSITSRYRTCKRVQRVLARVDITLKLPLDNLISKSLTTTTMADVLGTTSIDALPPELLTRVFEFLSCDRSHVDIANSRLVSKQFHAISSPFLIATVVIADRYDTLQKLSEVLDHPYFSKHVTRLVWDASLYGRGAANHLFEYHHQCELKPWSSSTIAAHCESRGMDLEELARLQDAVGKALHGGDWLMRRAGGIDLSLYYTENEVGSDSDDKKMRDSLIRLAHDDYRLREAAQIEIRLNSLSLKPLETAFEKLPMLRHFEFSDFRALARSGETLRELCGRIFGQPLSPDLLPDDEQGEMVHALEDLRLQNCLHRLAKISPRLKSLSFGRSNLNSWDALQCNASPRMVMSDIHTKEENYWRPLLGCIQHLSLPVQISYDEGIIESYWPVPSTHRLLSDSAASLTHLDLETGLYSGLSREFWNLSAMAKPVFAQILDQIHFPKLTSVVLRGWLFSLQDLENFLLAHATTLRNVHLINCCLAEASKDELVYAIRTRLEPALSLAGVEIYALMYGARCLERHVYKIRQRRSHIQELPNEDEDDDEAEQELEMPMPRDQVSLDRSDLEDFFLGGRHNVVTRVERKNADWMARKRWWRDLGEEDSDDEPDDPATPMSSGSSQDSDSDGYHCQGFLGAIY
jgi:hypothetical protein